MARTGKRAGEQGRTDAVTTLTAQYAAGIGQRALEFSIDSRGRGASAQSDAAHSSMLALAKLLGQSAATTFQAETPLLANSHSVGC